MLKYSAHKFNFDILDILHSIYSRIENNEKNHTMSMFHSFNCQSPKIDIGMSRRISRVIDPAGYGRHG